jgi:acyl carrier protein
MIINLQEFIKKISEQFDETDANEFKAATEFKKLIDWNSVCALSIIAVIDDEFGVIINGDDIRKSKTIEDLFNIVKENKS